MGDFLRIIIDSLAYLWPFGFVQQYERGVYKFCGKALFECKPGWPYPKLPWFCEIVAVMTVRDTVQTEMQTVETSDGGTVTFSATAWIEVTDATAAHNKVSHHAETAVEDIAAILAEKLAEVEPERLAPAQRGRLVGACKQSLGATLADYGVTIRGLRFNNFIRNIPVARLFNDQLYGGSK